MIIQKETDFLSIVKVMLYGDIVTLVIEVLYYDSVYLKNETEIKVV